MRILALETSSLGGSVAAWERDGALVETVLPTHSRSAQSLAPAVAETLSQAGWRPRDIQAVAVTQGPGSFTGLRVGAATAKTLAYAVGAALLGVNTLEAIAVQAPPATGEVWTLLDAHRGQLFVGRYRLGVGRLPEATEPPHIENLEDWIGRYRPEQPVMGPGIARLASRLPPHAAVLASELGTPRAAAVARLAWLHWQQGRRDDLWSFAPCYYRPSAAEEKHG